MGVIDVLAGGKEEGARVGEVLGETGFGGRAVIFGDELPEVPRRKKKVCYERKRFQPVYSRECGAAKSAVLRFGRP